MKISENPPNNTYEETETKKRNKETVNFFPANGVSDTSHMFNEYYARIYVHNSLDVTIFAAPRIYRQIVALRLCNCVYK